MEAYQERVVLEKKELDEKISKLSPFISSEKFLSVEQNEADRLRNQLSVMIDYSNILGERIANF
jgi:hypothetical protein